MFLRLLMIAAVVLGLTFSSASVPTVFAWGGPGGDSVEDDAAETGEDGGGGEDEGGDDGVE